MGKYTINLIVVALLYTSVTYLGACGHFSGTKRASKGAVQPIPTDEPLVLQLRGIMGRKEISDYRSHAIIKTYEKNELTKEKTELVDFSVETETVLVDRNQAKLHTRVKTIKKDGPVDLHDMAFPELNEEIPFIMYPNAEVISAGDFPPTSVFYVPPISLPNRYVKVGDTWEITRAWLSEKNALPLQVDMITIFKNLLPCPDQGVCADLEVSGQVSIPGQTEDSGLELKSKIYGRVLFSINNGTVLWSQVNSQETVVYGDTRIDISSCLASKLAQPKEDRWPYAKDVKCNPMAISVDSVPGVVSL